VQRHWFAAGRATQFELDEQGVTASRPTENLAAQIRNEGKQPTHLCVPKGETTARAQQRLPELDVGCE
jgi:hypothetical protein